jgi:hypothetical protein
MRPQPYPGSSEMRALDGNVKGEAPFAKQPAPWTSQKQKATQTARAASR